MSEFPAVETLLPHRGAMLLIDEVVRWEPGKSTTSRRRVREDEVLAIDGKLPTLASLELMAQTIALHHGLEAHARGDASGKGFLVGCRDMRCHVASFAPGDVLEMTVTHLFGEGQLVQFRCKTTRDDVLVAEATIGVFAGPIDVEP